MTVLGDPLADPLGTCVDSLGPRTQFENRCFSTGYDRADLYLKHFLLISRHSERGHSRTVRELSLYTINSIRTYSVRFNGHYLYLCICRRAEKLRSHFFHPTMDTTVGNTENRQLPWLSTSPGQSNCTGSVPESSFVIAASTESLPTQYTTLSALQGSFISIQPSPNSAEFQSLQAIILWNLDVSRDFSLSHFPEFPLLQGSLELFSLKFPGPGE